MKEKDQCHPRNSPLADRESAMKISISQQMIDDLAHSVSMALATRGIVNVPQLAEEIRRRYEPENVALEDIAELVMAQAQKFSAAMEFDRPTMN